MLEASPPTKQDEADGGDEWKAFPLSAYQELTRQMAHFSMKAVNSNAEAGGIRLTAAAALHGRPYLSVRTLLGAGQPVAIDYLKNVGSTATLTKQLRAALAGKAPPDEGPAICAAYEQALQKPLQTGTDQLSPRLRQILLPSANAPGGYLAVTPLSAAGTASLTSQWVREHNEAYKAGLKDKATHRRIRTATLGFGGSNPQNVGALIRDLQTLIVVEGPTESPGLRAALALHYQGPELRLPAQAVAAYAEWRRQALAACHGEMPTDLPHRETERGLIQDLMRAVLAAVARQCSVLRQHADRLPVTLQPDGEPSLFAPGVPAWRKGLLETGWRGADWAGVTADQLAAAVLHHRDPKGRTLGLGDANQAHLSGLMKEVLS
ncbi:MAG: hypothetical protein RLY71_1021 [Pseudomonadota bacterium]|jgi:hypothetical protein